MVSPINTGAAEDLSSHVDQTRVGGAARVASVTLQRPASRSSKQKKYKQALTQRQQETPIPLANFCLGLVQRLRQLDAEARKKKNRDIATFFQYYDCNEYGEFDDAGQWNEDAQNDEEFGYSLPITPAHVDSAKTLLLKTALEYEYKPKNKSSVLDMQLAKMCEELAEEDMTRIFPDDLKGREALYLLLAGKSYRCHAWAPDPLEPEVTEIPVYSQSEKTIPAARICGNEECGQPLKDDDAVCPKCLCDKILTVEGGSTKTAQMSNRNIALSENQLHIPNPLAVQHDLSKTKINFSPIVERDTLSRAEAEFLYCQVLPNKRDGISEEMKIVRELERARLRTDSNNLRGDDRTLMSYFSAGDDELVERERCWLLPWQYANFLITEDRWYYTKQDGLIWCEKDEDVPESAEHIKSGTFWGDVFPSGAFLCVVDDTVVEINKSSVFDQWIKLIYGMRPSNADGSGMQRLRPLADIINDCTNLDIKVLMDDADPKTFLNRKYLSHLAKVGEYNLVDNLKEGDTWDKVVYRLEGSGSHPNLGGMNQHLQGVAQFLVGTFSSMGAGAPDVKASGTATGVVKMAEEAAGRFLEAIQQMKTADIDSRYKVLQNIQKHSIQPQIDKLKKRFGANVTQRFLSANLKQVIAVTVKKGTDQPQSQAIKLAQVQAYSEAAAQFGQHPQAISLMQEMAELIGLPIGVGIGMTDKQEAERRLGMMSEFTEKFNGELVSDPQRMEIAVEVISAVLSQCEYEPLPEPEPEMMPMPAADVAVPPSGPEAGAPMPGQGNNIETSVMPDTAMMPPLPLPEPPKPDTPSIVMMQEHPVFMDAYRDWLQTEGARCDNNVLCTAVQMMWKLHFEREKEKQIALIRIEGEKQLEIERMKAEFAQAMAPPPPDPAQIAALEQQQTDAAAAENQKAQEDQIVMDTVNRIADEEVKDADYKREQQAKDEDLEREALKRELDSDLSEKESKLTMK